MTEAKAETSSTDLGARRRSNWADPMVTPFVLQTLRKVFPAATDGCTTHLDQCLAHEAGAALPNTSLGELAARRATHQY